MRALVVVAIAMLVALAGFALAPKQPPAQQQPYWTLSGTTDQGEVFRLRLDAKRRVRTFEATVAMYCAGGRVELSGWGPSEGGAPARFGSRGPHFEATELKRLRSGVVLGGTLRGTIFRKRASGTLEMSRNLRGREQCTSGLVSWTAR